MIAGKNLAILNGRGVDVPKAKATTVIAPLHLEHLIEVAIENFTAPTDIDHAAAHQAVHRGRIKILDQQLHIFVELVVVPQIGGEARDRKIRDRVEFVEDNPQNVFSVRAIPSWV